MACMPSSVVPEKKLMIANNRLGFYWTVLLLRAVTKERVAVEGPCFDLQQTELVRSI